MAGFKRSLAIDFFKGIAIIGIVFIHTVFVSGWAYVPGYMRNFSLLVDVPLFFFLSGWGSSYSQDYYKKIKSIIKLCFRCIYFVALYTVLIFFVDRDLFKVSDLPYYFLFVVTQPGNIWSDFLGGAWFFNAFIPVNIIVPYFLLRDKKNSTYLVWGCIFALSLIWYKFLPNVLSLSVYFYFYALIYLLGYKAKNWYIPSVKDFILILIGTVLLIGLSFRFNGIRILESDLNQIKFSPSLPYLLYSLPAMEAVLLLRKRIDSSSNRFVNVVSLLGKNSIWIYFGQTYSLTLLGYISAAVHIDIWQVKLLLMFFINLILALLFAYLLSKGYSVTEKGFLRLFSKIKQYLSNFIIQGEV